MPDVLGLHQSVVDRSVRIRIIGERCQIDRTARLQPYEQVAPGQGREIAADFRFEHVDAPRDLRASTTSDLDRTGSDDAKQDQGGQHRKQSAAGSHESLVREPSLAMEGVSGSDMKRDGKDAVILPYAFRMSGGSFEGAVGLVFSLPRGDEKRDR